MNQRLLLITMSCLLSLLVGCVSTGPYERAPVGEPGMDDVSDYPIDEPSVSEPLPDEDTIEPVQPSTNSAVQSLINQSRAQYNAHNYQSAIATAERGLRIDRRSPDLYLLLAQSYVQLAMPQQADQFARQGLRYSQAGSAVADALLRVKQILAEGL